jgi:hypothetical protein
MLALLLAPFGLQLAAMLVDEVHFHRRRGLPRWERIGHPLDTLTVVAAYAWALAHAPDRGAVLGYVALAFFSCLFVTKDEPVHARECEPGEFWLHAVQFVLHPIVFLAFGLLWIEGGHGGLLTACLAAAASFGVYQTLYWNLPWKPAR